MTIEQDLQKYITTEVVLGATDNGEIKVDQPLLSSGIVDSLGLLQILSYIDQRYGVALLHKGGPRTFETIRALAAAIRKETNGAEVTSESA